MAAKGLRGPLRAKADFELVEHVQLLPPVCHCRCDDTILAPELCFGYLFSIISDGVLKCPLLERLSIWALFPTSSLIFSGGSSFGTVIKSSLIFSGGSSFGTVIK
jgi:hypothetical protein